MLSAIQQSRSWKLTAPLRMWAAMRRQSAIERMIVREQRRIRNRRSQQLVIGEIPELMKRKNTRPPRICAVVHVFYPELAFEIATQLKVVPHLERVIVTFAPHVHLDILKENFDSLDASIDYVEVENRGRDILPFVSMIPKLRETGCNVFVKLHTKRSPHIADEGGHFWRRSLINGLLPDAQSVSLIASVVANNDDVLYAVPRRWAAGRESWGRNKARARSIARRAGIKKLSNVVFPAGSMFWFGVSMIDLIDGFGLTTNDFEPEMQQLDGTTAHAVERLFGTSPASANSIRVLYEPSLLSTDGTLDPRADVA
jgi:lipopolysaccharide biosynthesis protein